MKIELNYQPTEVRLVEDIIGCLNTNLSHVFKIKIEEATEENRMRSLSMYSFRYDIILDDGGKLTKKKSVFLSDF